MSNQTVSVTPGAAPTLISQSMATGTTIYNQDSVNTVWLGSSPDVSPGNGIPLGPLGNLNWSGNAGVYAIPDTGVTAPVLLQISGDVSTLDNPVAIGTAVATQLLAQGIPNVLRGEVIYHGSMSGIGFPPEGLDVSGYASVTVLVGIKNVLCNIGYYYQDNVTGILFGGRNFHITAANPFSFTSTVLASSLHFTTTNPVPDIITVYASNRPLADKVLSVSTHLSFSQSATWGNGQSIQLGSITTNGGPIYCRLNVSGTGKGYLGYYAIDTGTAGSLKLLADTGGSHVAANGDGTEQNITLVLPAGNIALAFYSVVAATYNVQIEFVPNTTL